MKLIKIAFSNIRKRKSSAITFFAIVVMAALMLSISLSLIMNTGSFYDRKRKELNTPDYTAAISGDVWKDEMLVYANNYQGVREVEYTEGYMADVKYKLGSSRIKQQLLVYDETVEKSMNTYTVIDKLKTKPERSIILTVNFKYNGFKSGDKFVFECVNRIYEFTVYGFFEDAQLGASTTSVKNSYIDTESYGLISQDPNFVMRKNISLKFDRLEISYEFQSDFLNEYKLSSTTVFSGTYETTKLGATMFATIMSMVLILVAAIVMLIAFVIVRFSIINNIQEDIKTLGALKSIGYTSKQIMLSIIFQFLLIATVGSIAGVLIALLAAGYVGNVVSATSGLLWSGSSFFVPALISVLAITAVTALVTYLVARKSKAVTPINALRSGLGNHTFRKNYAPLEKTRLPLNAAAAVKGFVYNLKNNITAFVSLFLFAFMSIIGFSLYHNFVTDTSAFIQMIGAEPAEIQLVARNEDFTGYGFPEISAREGVVKTIGFDTFSTTSDGKLLNIFVWEDMTKKERSNLIDGRYPKNDNEMTLMSTAQKILNKNIGDIVNIEYEGVVQSYLVTGITQGIGEVFSDMTLEGFSRLKANPVLKCMYVFLGNSDYDYIDDYINALNIDYENKIVAVNLIEAIDSTLVALKSPIAIATYLISVIEVFTVCFVFFLLVNTIIRRRKREFGIMKAIGFTNNQLIIQILLSFLPVIVAGVLLGAIAGIFLTNPLLGLMFSSLGIAKPLFVIPAALTVVTEILLLIVCILTVCLVSLKTRRISPQRMITE